MTNNVVTFRGEQQTTVYLADLAVDDLTRMFPSYPLGDLKAMVDFLVDQGYMFDEPLDGDLILEVDEEVLNQQHMELGNDDNEEEDSD
jgi:hypothetical protein